MGLIDFRPYVRLKIDGTPVSDLAFSSLSYLSITDTSGFIADTADVTFSNMSPVSRFAMPEPGAEFDVALGYLGKFKRMGIYIADEIEENSPPRTITAVCRAKAQAETQGGYAPIHQHKTRSWPAGLTLGAIAKTIASENGLKSGITAAAASIMPGHIDQIDESINMILKF